MIELPASEVYLGSKRLLLVQFQDAAALEMSLL